MTDEANLDLGALVARALPNPVVVASFDGGVCPLCSNEIIAGEDEITLDDDDEGGWVHADCARDARASTR